MTRIIKYPEEVKREVEAYRKKVEESKHASLLSDHKEYKINCLELLQDWDADAFDTLKKCQERQGIKMKWQGKEMDWRCPAQHCPSVAQLMYHYKALPWMQRALFTPYSTFQSTPEHFLATIADVCDSLRSRSGEERNYIYSNANYCLLALLITTACGLPLDMALECIVLDAAKMKNTILTSSRLVDCWKKGLVAIPLFLIVKGTR